MVTAISAVKALDAGSSPDSSAQIAALQRQVAAAQKDLLAVQKGAPDKASEQQQKMIAQRIVTFQARIAPLQASGGQKGIEQPAVDAAGPQAQSDNRISPQERQRAPGGALGSIIDTQA
jgi:hypothetical protein